MTATIQELLQTVETRLGETIEAFTVMRTINENCNADVNATLYATINNRSGFWRPVNAGLQTAFINGIFAVLDKNRSDSATLYLVIKKLKSLPNISVPPTFETDLDTIKDRYSIFRHKLFGHNDINRETFANDFDKAGFTWLSLEADLKELEYIFKCLWQMNSNNQIPDKVTASSLVYPYNLGVINTQKHTLEFINDISNAQS